MNCQEIQQLKHACADGELDPLRSAEVEAHLRQCAGCARTVEELKRMKTALADSGLYYPVPPGLAARIRASLPQPKESRSASAPASALPSLWLKWLFALGGTALAAVLLTATLLNPSASGRLVAEVSASHVRSLMAGHLTDVASTDQHTVKPWFDGKLDFAPPVVDLAADGFPLYGGRLDYLDSRPVAALVYQRQKHFINLFVWPSAENHSGEEKSFVHNGYNLIHWRQGGMVCWAVSDLNHEELASFTRLYQDHTTPTAK